MRRPTGPKPGRLRPGTAIGPVLFVAVLLARPGAPAAAEPPVDLGARLVHVAIVEEMVRACSHARPDLDPGFAGAWKAWHLRNGAVAEALRAIEHATDDPYGTAVRDLYGALQGVAGPGRHPAPRRRAGSPAQRPSRRS